MVAKGFADGPWDFVFNLAGETKYSQTPAVYKENINDVTVTCAKQAAASGVKRFIEVSTSQVYASDKVCYITPISSSSSSETFQRKWKNQTMDCFG